MRKKLSLIAVCTFLMPMSYSGAEFAGGRLLTDEDISLEIQQTERGLPALSSEADAEAPWASYNQWLCFRSAAIAVKCSEIEFSGVRRIPTVVAQTSGHFFEMDVPHEWNWNCDAVIQEWASLIKGTDEVCVFAAHLQPIDQDSSLWILDRIKSERGYWLPRFELNSSNADQEVEP